MDYGTRIRDLMKGMQCTQLQFSERIGISPSRLNSYLTGRSEPDYEILVKLANILDTTIDYIIGHTDNAAPYVIKASRVAAASGPVLNDEEQQESIPFYVKLPIYLSSAEPVGSTPVEARGWSTVNSLQKKIYPCHYVLFIDDAGMEPEIKKKDYLFMQKLATLPSSGVYAVRLSADDKIGLCVRRCIIEKDRIIALADNNKYPPVIFDKSLIDFDPIMGEVIVIYREY